MMNNQNFCETWQADLNLLAADLLSESNAAAVRQHLTACPTCSERWRQLAAVATGLQQLRPATLELHRVQQRVLSRTMSAIELVEPSKRNASRRGSVVWRWIGGGIVAAAFLATVTWFGFQPIEPSVPKESVANLAIVSSDSDFSRPTLRAYEIAFAQSDESFDSLLQKHSEKIVLSSPDTQSIFREALR